MDQVLCSFSVPYLLSSLPRPVVTKLLVDPYNASLGAVDVVVLFPSPVSGKQHLTAGYDIFSQVTTSIHWHWLQKKWLTAATGGTGIIKSRLYGSAEQKQAHIVYGQNQAYSTQRVKSRNLKADGAEEITRKKLLRLQSLKYQKVMDEDEGSNILVLEIGNFGIKSD